MLLQWLQESSHVGWARVDQRSRGTADRADLWQLQQQVSCEVCCQAAHGGEPLTHSRPTPPAIRRALDWSGNYAASLKPGTAAATRTPTTDMARPSRRAQAGFARVQRQPTTPKASRPSGNRMKRSSRDFSGRPDFSLGRKGQVPRCECGQSAVQRVSNSNANPERRYWTCTSKNCRFFRWVGASR